MAVSTVQVMNMVGLGESLRIFDEVGMEAIEKKRVEMNIYFDLLIKDLQSKGKGITVATPRDHSQRGAQLSIRIEENPKAVFNELIQRGIIGDWRSPDMIRLSPAPLYNTFRDLFQVYTTLLEIV